MEERRKDYTDVNERKVREMEMDSKERKGEEEKLSQIFSDFSLFPSLIFFLRLLALRFLFSFFSVTLRPQHPSGYFTLQQCFPMNPLTVTPSFPYPSDGQ
jgi:hypothetical protein